MVFRDLNQTSEHANFDLHAIDTLLKSVARTFYLSLTYLPKVIREPMSVAYLLARLSDTVVDAQTVPLSIRTDLLFSLQLCVEHPQNLDYQNHLNQKINLCIPYFSGRDLNLLQRCGFLLTRFQRQSASIQALIQQVLVQIFQGQAIDLNYFDNNLEIKFFTTAHELDRYVYLVAGSVGEFWTRLCCLCVPNFTQTKEEQLIPKAIAFGKALQLTNILKDLGYDLTQGRCYLPAENAGCLQGYSAKESPQVLLQQLIKHNPTLIQDWQATAVAYLAEAKAYTQVITNRRIRFSVIVPMHLAHKTLLVIPDKLSKTDVYFSMAHAWLQTYGFSLGAVNK